MSEKVELRLLEMLGHPTESPYGNPIPGLEELGDPAAPAFMDGVVNLVDRAAESSGAVNAVIRRLGEPVQFEPELLAQLRDAGVMPGARVAVQGSGAYILVTTAERGPGLELPHEIASHVYVDAQHS